MMEKTVKIVERDRDWENKKTGVCTGKVYSQEEVGEGWVQVQTTVLSPGSSTCIFFKHKYNYSYFAMHSSPCVCHCTNVQVQ